MCLYLEQPPEAVLFKLIIPSTFAVPEQFFKSLRVQLFETETSLRGVSVCSTHSRVEH